jgi:hypothetical protein
MIPPVIDAPVLSGLGGGPIAAGLRDTGLGPVDKIVDQSDQASVQALVSKVDMAEFKCRPHPVLTNIWVEWIENVGNAERRVWVHADHPVPFLIVRRWLFLLGFEAMCE